MGIDSLNIKSGCVGKCMRGRLNNTGDKGCETRRKSYREFIKRCVRISVPLLLLLFAASISIADFQDQDDDIKFERLSIEQGLPQSTIFCILQDKRGFMWFGTQHGLSRYDGHTFKLYDYNPKNPKSLSQNLVISLYEDDLGTIWVGTWGGGLNRFDRKTEKFEVYKNIPGNQNSLSNNNVWSIYEDRENVLWVGTDKGLNKFDKEREIFTTYLEERMIAGQTGGNRVNTIYQDRSGILWIGADDGLHKCESKGNFTKIKCKGGCKGPTPQKIRVICGDKKKDNVLWLGTEGGLYKFILENGKIIHDNGTTDKLNELKDKQISQIYRDSSGILWVGTLGHGLYILDPLLERLTQYKNIPGNPDSLSNDDVRAIYEDRSGLIWIGTYTRGLNKYDPQRKKFTLYRNIPKNQNNSSNQNQNSLTNNDIMTISNGKGGVIWLGTWGGGTYNFNLENKKSNHYEIPYSVSQNSNRNNIRAICEDDDSVLWVGTGGAGLYRFEPRKKNFIPYIIKDSKENEERKEYIIGPEEYILIIYLDKEGVLWIGTLDKGLTKIEKNREKYKNYRYEPQNHQSLSEDKVYSILEDRSGILWIGTGNGGLNRFDREKEEFKRYQPSGDKPDSISHNFITAICEDRDGTLWIGTNGGGLNKFDRQKETFTAFTTKNGLPNNVIYDILEDYDGSLWLSTNKGLSRFTPKDKKFRNYTVRDGLQDLEFSRGTAWKSESGKMFFGGVNGFNVFDPKELKSKDRLTPPPIVITSFKKRSQEVKLNTSIPEVDQLELSYKDTSISFEFAALSFPDPERNRYVYKLEPVDQEWIDLGNKHVVDLINLKPGEYIFRVKGSNSDGFWNEEGKSIEITVNPPFWETWWFYTLAVLFIGSAIFCFVRWRIMVIERANKQLELEIVERKRAEELYRNLVETSPDAITLSDAATEKLIMANHQAANLLGYSSEEEIKREVKNIFDIFSQNDREKAKKNAEKVIMTGVNRNTEYTLMSKDKTPIAAELSTALIRDAAGNPKYILSTARDIRKRKEEEKQEKLQQERLVQLDRMASLGTLVSGVAHELNNPLSSIKMNAESFSKVWKDVVPVLDKHYEENKDFKMAKMPYKYSKSELEGLIIGLIDSSQRIERIIDVLRDFSRPGGGGNYTRQPIDINKVIESSIELTNNMVKKATQNFSFKPGRNLPLFEGNFQKLEQVFINLIQNACQALPDNSKKIEISTIFEIKKKRIIITVEDEGVGIEEKNLKYIFDPFFTTKRESGGTGLGLSISSQIIQEHGGSLMVESTVSKGTIIIINLPVTSFKKEINVNGG
jgi:PAS domain S-box-containing protein